MGCLVGKCYNSTVINASVGKIWERARNFHDMKWAKNVVQKLDVVGEARPDQVGAKRVLNGAIHETLVGIDESRHWFKYRITDGPGPLAKNNITLYYGEFQLLPVTDSDSTYVMWTSEYNSSDDNAVAEFCDPVYRGLLADLKASF